MLQKDSDDYIIIIIIMSYCQTEVRRRNNTLFNNLRRVCGGGWVFVFERLRQCGADGKSGEETKRNSGDIFLLRKGMWNVFFCL